MKILDWLSHRRILLFWTVAILEICLPWFIQTFIKTVSSTGKVTLNCEVLKIYDGDTITVRCNSEKIRVRLHCIDTPEIAQKPWGIQSRDYLRELTGATVHIKSVGEDRYKRTIGIVTRPDGLNLNMAMVEAGQAAVYNKYCSDSEFHEAEQVARDSNVGGWFSAGLHQTPWEYRRLKRHSTGK